MHADESGRGQEPGARRQEDPSAIRRGRGLSLSGAEEPGLAGHDLGDTIGGAAGARAIRRGKGLRLSTSGADPAAAPPPASALPPPPGAASPAPWPLTRDSSANGAHPPFAPIDVAAPTEAIRLPHGVVRFRRAGDGPPLVLIHGWGASSRYWLPTLAALAPRRSLYALDLPGFGESPALDTLATIERLAEIVIAFADGLGLRVFDLAGHSFGASVAVLAAARRPEQVRRLALTSFGVWGDDLAKMVLAIGQGGARLALSAWYPWLNLAAPLTAPARLLAGGALNVPPLPQLIAAWYMDRPPSDERLLRAGLADLAAMDPRAHLACLASVGDPSVDAALADLAMPALLITGDRDRVSPPEAQAAAARRIPSATAVVLERCGHIPMFEQPLAYHSALAAFLG